MSRWRRYDEQIQEKAVPLVRDHAEDYPTAWAAIKAVPGRLGMTAGTLRKWVAAGPNSSFLSRLFTQDAT